MKKINKIAVIGGDLRQIILAKEFSKAGTEVALFGFESYRDDVGNATRAVTMRDTVQLADAVILPLPYSHDREHINAPYAGVEISVSKLIGMLEKTQTVIGGRLDEAFYSKTSAIGIKCRDFYECPELKTLNAIPTAEGAVCIAMQETIFTIHGSKCAVLSFGKVGEALAKTLDGLGARVTVVARKPEAFARIRMYGYTPRDISELSDVVAENDIIFNAIPEFVLDSAMLLNVRKSTVIIDLASKPGGVDFKTAKELGLNVIWALSIPSKSAPETAGMYIAESIKNIFLREGFSL